MDLLLLMDLFQKNPFVAAKIRTLGASKESVLSSRAIEERVDILLKALKKS